MNIEVHIIPVWIGRWILIEQKSGMFLQIQPCETMESQSETRMSQARNSTFGDPSQAQGLEAQGRPPH